MRNVKIVTTINDAAKKQGKIITGSTHTRIEEILKKAEEVGVIRGSEEVITSRIALSAAAIRAAEDEGKVHVTVRHLHKGWRDYYSHATQCPPHLCLFRSVITRKSVLQSSDTVFRQLAGLTDKE